MPFALAIVLPPRAYVGVRGRTGISAPSGDLHGALEEVVDNGAPRPRSRTKHAGRRKDDAMSLSPAIILNAILDAAILGGLAFIVSRPTRLRPHEPAAVRAFELVERTEEYEQPRAA